MKLFEISLPVLPLRGLTFKTVYVSKQKDVKGRKKIRTTKEEKKKKKHCV